MVNQPPAAALKDSLVCPCCHGALAWAADEITCNRCRHTFPIDGGIPIMVPPDAPDQAGDELQLHKRRQANYFDEHEDADFEVSRPRGTPRLYRWMMDEKFRRSVAGLAEAGCRTALTVCGGSGMDAEHLCERDLQVIVSDISLGAARRAYERARRFDVPMAVIVADVERLPFPDASVDLVYVHDGLHHLSQPLTGLKEMTRVAAKAVSVTEPAQATATALAVKVGLSIDVEDAGNRVERLQVAELVDALRRDGLRATKAERYALFYRHEPGPAMKAFSTPALFPAATLGWRVFNATVGRFGNKLTVQATR